MVVLHWATLTVLSPRHLAAGYGVKFKQAINIENYESSNNMLWPICTSQPQMLDGQMISAFSEANLSECEWQISDGCKLSSRDTTQVI